MAKGKRRAAMRADKKRRKSERYKLGGKGQSTYAKKLRGERTAASIEAESRPQAFCSGCFMRRARCRCTEIALARIAEIEARHNEEHEVAA